MIPPKISVSNQSLPLMSEIVQALTLFNYLEKYWKVCFFLILNSYVKVEIPTCFVQNYIKLFNLYSDSMVTLKKS